MLFAVGLIGILLITTFAVGAITHLDNAEPYSELYVLPPNHIASYYALNATVGQKYSYLLGVGNHLGYSGYYMLYVKMSNGSDSLPDLIAKTPSALPSLFEYKFVVLNNELYEMPFNFSIADASVEGGRSVIKTLTLNDVPIQVDISSQWNSTTSSSYYQLFFELWLYNAQAQTFQYNNRFVTLSMNFTQPASQLPQV
jgi:uncharacterized membrane protein